MTIIPINLQIKKPSKRLISLMNQNELSEVIMDEFESNFHTISIVENAKGRYLKFDDTYQAGYINSPCYKGNLPYINYFLIPILMNPKIENVLFIGLGSGILVNQYENLLNLKNIDIVDIEENIFEIAKKYFNFKASKIQNFYLQDALIYLKTSKKKYDLIISDVAGDEGIDERFCEENYLLLIKKHLKKDGIFVSNMPSSRDIFNPKNKFALDLIELYKSHFASLECYSGEESNRIFYKTFFDLDEIVYDVTNLILISSDKKFIKTQNPKLNEIIDIQPYTDDLIFEECKNN